MYRLKSFYSYKTADQRRYNRMEYGMADRKTQNKVKLTSLCIHLTYLLC